MLELRETTWEYVAGDGHGTFCTAQKKWINKIHKWKQQYPDDVDIVAANTDGSMLVRLPESWCKISPKKRVVMTDEQKRMAKERLAINRAKR